LEIQAESSLVVAQFEILVGEPAREDARPTKLTHCLKPRVHKCALAFSITLDILLIIMKKKPLQPGGLSAGIVFLALLFSTDAFGANMWITRTNGLWRTATNWSSGRPPSLSLGSSTLITNAVSKTVTIDAATLPTNLFLNSLTISAPPNTTNTLKLEDVGTDRPLTLVNGSELKITRGGVLVITNSSLVLTGSFGSGFNVFAGNVTLDSGSIRIMEDPGETNITVLVRIGRTNAATLTINGGSMQAGTLLLGDTPFPQYRSQGTARINGGSLSLSGELSVGNGLLGTGTMEVMGGELIVAHNQTNITRIGDQGAGQMVVSNATVQLADVSVARHDGAHGTLTVLSNGVVDLADDLSIGRFSGATGSVVVAGGQLLNLAHPVWVGREGIGQLTVSNGLFRAASLHVAIVPTNTARGTATLVGGSTMLSSNLLVGSESNSFAQMLMAGGSLDVTNDANTGAVNVPRGTFTFSGGTMTADNIFLTNSTGQFLFRSGTLRTKNTVVANASPFVLGDGTNAATLELLGGTHSFADGLIISSNATLTGCGTVIGSIVNHGTINTNCGGNTGVPPMITQQPASLTVTQGATAVFSVVATGDPPLSYQWRAGFLMGNIPGATNSTLTLTNVEAAQAGNFRVIVSNPSGTVPSSMAILKVLVAASITGSSLSGTDFNFSFQSVNGLTYLIEYKQNLDDLNWTPLRTVTGDGGVILVMDGIIPGQTRFYRVSTE
jgi:T5SS/PEP-CTERM-associated repeat protein